MLAVEMFVAQALIRAGGRADETSAEAATPAPDAPQPAWGWRGRTTHR
jgi:hypothetical protein